jgi:hypothetical protein
VSQPEERGEPKDHGSSPYDPPWLDEHGRLHHEDGDLLSELQPGRCYCCPWCNRSVCNDPDSDGCIGLDCEI